VGLLGLEARSFRGGIAAVPLWKVIVGATAGKLVNRTLHGSGFFISGAGGDARLHGTERRLKFLPQSVGQGKHMAWTTPILVEICIGLEINGYLPAEF
jgi:coenzyme PQQ precursor peptide PqqA